MTLLGLVEEAMVVHVASLEELEDFLVPRRRHSSVEVEEGPYHFFDV